MELHISPATKGMSPQVELPHPGFLKHLTEAGMRKLISDHYNLIKDSRIRELFPPSDQEFEEAKKRAADFFIQICGGPSYYNENRGNPMLRKRHAPFKITPEARVVWLDCYRQLLPHLNVPEEAILSFWKYLDVFSIWMINTPGNK